MALPTNLRPDSDYILRLQAQIRRQNVLLAREENIANDPDGVTDPELQAHASTEASFRVRTDNKMIRKAGAPKARSVELVNALRAQQAVKTAISGHSKHRVTDSRRADIGTHATNAGRGPRSTGL